MTTTDPLPSASATRDLLICAAEQLMAEHGIEGAELREINRLAGQRNRSAVHYHFTDREGLIAAIRDKHRPAIDQARTQRLDQLQATGDPDIAALVRALVEPMAAPLATESGRNFLIIVADAAGRAGSRALLASDLPYTNALTRLTGMLIQRVHGTPARRQALVRHAVLTSAVLLADLARDINARRINPSDSRPHTETIIDYITHGLDQR
jgi:AcrR family transcriptional regulator